MISKVCGTTQNASVSKGQNEKRSSISNSSLVPRAGLEPARGIPRQILSLLRLPIPPSRQPMMRFLDIGTNSSTLYLGCGLAYRSQMHTNTVVGFTGVFRPERVHMFFSSGHFFACQTAALPKSFVACSPWFGKGLLLGDRGWIRGPGVSKNILLYLFLETDMRQLFIQGIFLMVSLHSILTKIKMENPASVDMKSCFVRTNMNV